jgi:hypothetical protein
MVYHLTYHSTIGLHINHLLFLHGYLFGVFLACACAGPPTSLVSAVAVSLPGSLLVGYSELLGGRVRPSAATSCLISRVLLCGAQPLITVLIGTLAWWVAGYPLGHVSRITLGLSGLGGALVCLIAQVIGHFIFEPITAGPNLFHGFVAAVVLEWFALVVRLGGASLVGLDGVWEEAARLHAIAVHEKGVRSEQQALISPSSPSVWTSRLSDVDTS